MAKHVHRNASLADIAYCTKGAFSGMKFLVDLFSDKAPNVSDSKAFTVTDIPMVTSYNREACI